MNKEKHLAWLKERQFGLGGSDIASIFGKSSFKKDKYSVYYEKTREITMDDIKEPAGYAKTGVDLEASTLNDYEKLKGIQLDRSYGGYQVYKHKDTPILLASLDGFDKVNNTVVEVKVITNKAKQDLWLSSNGEYIIPIEYKLQVAHYCNVINADKADVIVRFMPSNKEVIITYERNKELEKVITEAALAFWSKYVEPKQEPRVGTDSYELALSKLDVFEDDSVPKTQAPLDVQSLIKDVVLNQQKIKELEQEAKEKKAQILQYCKDNYTHKLYDTDFENKLVSVIKYKGRASFDSARFKEENAELHSKYIKEGNPYNVLKLNIGE
jgi:putative phage-type endonuclease